MASVQLQQVTKSYDGKQNVIHGIDLDIQHGEFVVFVGPSGCGKSTLLRMIAGLESITGGDVLIDGVRVNDQAPRHRDIAMVFQDYALYPHKSLYDNMAFGLRLRKMPEDEIKRRVMDAARLLRIDHMLDRKPAALSGGQRQRVAIGRAIVRQPKVFLFDEPLSNLDAQLRGEMRSEIKKLHQRLGATIIYVTHDQVEAMTLASRIVVMKGGVIQQIGAPTEVYERPANLFVAGFLGAPGMNLVPGQLSVSASGEVGLSGALSADLAAYPFQQQPHDGQGVLLGIRPEHVRLDPQGAWRGVVHLIEPMGNHQVVWIQCGAQLLAAIVEDHVQMQPDQALSFQLDLARASLFDQASEQRL